MNDAEAEVTRPDGNGVGARRRRGRPRSTDTDRRIVAAAQQLLIERGYARMSIDAVAAAAGVGKPTIYRRYPSKVELAAAALVALPRLATQPPEGDARSQLIWVMRRFLDLERRLDPWALLGNVLAEEHRHPELLAHVRERIILPRRNEMRTILTQGVERGEVRADLDLETAVDMLAGPLFTRRVATGHFPADWPEALVDEVWHAIASQARGVSATVRPGQRR